MSRPPGKLGKLISRRCEKCSKVMHVRLHRILNKRGRFCSLKCKRVGIFTPEVREKMSLAKRGRPVPSRQGDKCHFWRGGVTPENKKIRLSLMSRVWRTQIFKRDNYTCQICRIRGGKLHADHIKSFSMFPKHRFSLKNGRTLCVTCHGKTDNYGRKALKVK